MSCTTILVGKKASYDGSTMIARNDDSGSGHFTAKCFAAIPCKAFAKSEHLKFLSEENPKEYTSVLSHVKVKLPEKAYHWTAMPNAVGGKGIWAACGVNEKNVGMTATETITSNERVLGADPLVEYRPAQKDAEGREIAPEEAGGLGEEDLVVLTLPYISNAREGVKRLGALLEEYGTYETNGIGFSDANEIWWFESIGGHHWMAKRVPDDSYVVMPNQLGIDEFDMNDAFGDREEHLCSADLREFIRDNHLDLSMHKEEDEGILDSRAAFGSHEDADHVYNTPRAWYMLRYFNPHTTEWDGPDASFTPESDDLPWSMVPEKKITPEDVKYILSSHFQGTPYDPYRTYGDLTQKGAYRSIGINRNDFMGFIQIRPYVPEEYRAIEWIAYASNAFNAMVPFYANIRVTPDYLFCTDKEVSTDSFYWTSRMIAAMADASYKKSLNHIEHYQEAVQTGGHRLLNKWDQRMTEVLEESKDSKDMDISAKDEKVHFELARANNEIADMLRTEAQKTLDNCLYELSNLMKNCYARSDA
ncbi:MAG: C69 family dipeptidase [Eubacterium sp.]|nr:C69 family dipeptidase [Eubacterium sp.]